MILGQEKKALLEFCRKHDDAKIQKIIQESYEKHNYEGLLKEAFMRIPEGLELGGEGREDDVSILFIDISGFSSKVSEWKSSEIVDYLNEYYKLIIPCFYYSGAEIERLQGDGVIAVFSKIFNRFSPDENEKKALKIARKLIKHFHNGKFECKCALARGLVQIVRVGNYFYNECTMIGQPLTELYRLETIAEKNQIVALADLPTSLSTYSNLLSNLIRQKLDNDYLKLTEWRLKATSFDLQGLGKKEVLIHYLNV